MARAKTGEPLRTRAKPNVIEELTLGIAKLRELSTHIDDLSRDGFPYGEAVRARTELSLRETIRRLFGEKSQEYQTHKNHKLRIGTRSESALSTGLLKELILALERQKDDLLSLKPASLATPETAGERPPATTTPSQPASDSSPGKTTQETPSPTGETVSDVPDTAPAAITLPVLPVTQTAPVPVSSPPQQITDTPGPQTIRDSSTPRRHDPPSIPRPDVSQIGTASIAASLDETPSHSTRILHDIVPPVQSVVNQPAPQATEQVEVRPDEGTTAECTAPASVPLPTLPPVPDTTQERLLPAPPEPFIPLPEPENPSMAITTHDRPPSTTELPVAQVLPSPPGTENATLDQLRKVCTRFHLVARQLRLRKEYRPTLEINDDYDLQDLFYALLRLQFDEVGTEEWSPDYADGARRTAYLLDWERTAVVVKQTRPGLSTKDLAEQVKVDADHYSRRPNGSMLLCFIYDPDGRIGNPRGLEADLAMAGGAYAVEVIVAPK